MTEEVSTPFLQAFYGAVGSKHILSYLTNNSLVENFYFGRTTIYNMYCVYFRSWYIFMLLLMHANM